MSEAAPKDPAVCRGCRKQLSGDAFCYGGRAYDLQTGEEAKINWYGGFVCSRRCDFRASLEMEQDMPGHSMSQKTLGCFAERSVETNWPGVTS